VAEDWLLSRLAAVESAALVASEELAAVPEGLARTRADRVTGLPLPDLARELAETPAMKRRRIAHAAAHRSYEQAVGALRAEVSRALVDEECVPISTLARAMGISRQAVTRLYESGTDLLKRDPR
jgi:hypothetical protein